MQNDPPSPRPTRHAEVMNRQPNRVSPRAGAQAGGMNAYDLSYRQSLIAVGALCLWLLTVIAAFHFLEPIEGAAASTATASIYVAFYKALPQLGRGQ